jgi:hypothetical protein
MVGALSESEVEVNARAYEFIAVLLLGCNLFERQGIFKESEILGGRRKGWSAFAASEKRSKELDSSSGRLGERQPGEFGSS